MTLSYLPPGPSEDRQDLLEIVIPAVLDIYPELLPTLLSSGNRAFHRITVTKALEKVQVEIPVDLSSAPDLADRKIEAIINYPHLASSVRILRFVHPACTLPWAPPSSSSSPAKYVSSLTFSSATRSRATNQQHVADDDVRQPLWKLSSKLIISCTQLKGLDWQVGYGVNDTVWEAIGSCITLRRLRVSHPPSIHPALDPLSSTNFPRITPGRRLQLVQTSGSGCASSASQGASGIWELGPGWTQLESLELGPLSETGVKVVARHFESLVTSSIQGLSIETHFLDTLICTSIAHLGTLGVLTNLKLSTTGVKFDDSHLKGIIEGCRGLEELSLQEVEGHLSKDAWVDLDWPETLRSLEITIKEYTKHKTWVLNHLESIHMVPFHQLRTFAVRRNLHPVENLPFPPTGRISAIPTTGMEEKPIPKSLLEAIHKTGNQLQLLCLDWWSMSGKQLLDVLARHKQLLTMEVSLSAPLTSLIVNMPKLDPAPLIEQILVSSNPAHYPAIQHVKKATYVAAISPDLPPLLIGKLSELDLNLSDIKDLKKFASRLPRLRILNWTGRSGRGEWMFGRKDNKSPVTKLSFTHSAQLTRQIWADCQSQPPDFNFPDFLETSPTSHSEAQVPVASTPELVGSVLSPVTTGCPSVVATPSSSPQNVNTGKPVCGNGSKTEDPRNNNTNQSPRQISQKSAQVSLAAPTDRRMIPRPVMAAGISPEKSGSIASPVPSITATRGVSQMRSFHKPTHSWPKAQRYLAGGSKPSIQGVPGSGSLKPPNAACKTVAPKMGKLGSAEKGIAGTKRGPEKAQGKYVDDNAGEDGWTVVGGPGKPKERKV